MNINQLRFASAVASSGSFTAAAMECCVTQPTLSNGIAQLESDLGGRLFARTTRKVALTPFGEQVIPYINEVLEAQARLVNQTQIFLNPAKRLIRIGTSPLVSANLLGIMIDSFRLRNPEVDLVLREMNMEDLYRMLNEGLLDFVFGVTEANKGSWSSTFLYDEPLFFLPRGAVWKTLPRPQSLRLKDIADETYVMVPDACGLSRATRALFRSQRRKLKEYSGEAMSYQMLEEWAAMGIGSAILPKSKVILNRQASFPITNKDGDQVKISFEAIWSRNEVQAPHLVDFSDHLRHLVPRMIDGLEPIKGSPISRLVSIEQKKT